MFLQIKKKKRPHSGTLRMHKLLIRINYFLHINVFVQILLLNYCRIQSWVQTRDSRDCMAASDHKHPGWCYLLPTVFFSAVWGRTLDGEGCCQTMAGDRDTSFLSLYFPCPTLPPSFTAWSTDNNSSVLAKQPGWLFYRQVRHWDCRDNGHKALQARSRTSAQSGRPGPLLAVSQSPPSMIQYHH